jgi:hypothetical protein
MDAGSVSVGPLGRYYSRVSASWYTLASFAMSAEEEKEALQQPLKQSLALGHILRGADVEMQFG